MEVSYVLAQNRTLADRMAGARRVQSLMDSRQPRTTTIMAQRDTSVLKRSF